MKKIILVLIASASCLAFGQVAIGKTAVTNSSVSLEFASGPKGIILPYVENTASISEPGTLILDASSGVHVKLKTSTGWFDYSAANSADIARDGLVDLSAQTGLQEKTEAKVIIGANSSTADGVLVLESNNKAMILPQMVAPELNVIQPASGTIMYDPSRKVLCVFNGKEWAYWEGAAN